MKKILKVLVLCLFLSVLPMEVMANVESTTDFSELKTHPYQRTLNPRGRYLSAAGISFLEYGDRRIGVYLDTMTHEPVDKVLMRAELERLDSKTGIWEVVDKQTIQFLKEDQPGQDLSMPSVTMNFGKRPSGSYRFKGTHIVWKDGRSESMGTVSGVVTLE